MRTLGRNMAWMIKKLNIAEEGHPQRAAKIRIATLFYGEIFLVLINNCYICAQKSACGL